MPSEAALLCFQHPLPGASVMTVFSSMRGIGCLHLTPEVVGAGGRRLYYQGPADSDEADNQEDLEPHVRCKISNRNNAL